MKDSKIQKAVGFISIEEQHREAKKDETGKIRKYLELAEKLFNADQNATPDSA